MPSMCEVWVQEQGAFLMKIIFAEAVEYMNFTKKALRITMYSELC